MMPGGIPAKHGLSDWCLTNYALGGAFFLVELSLTRWIGVIHRDP